MATQKIDFESFSNMSERTGRGFMVVFSFQDDWFLVVTRLYAVPISALKKFHDTLMESGLISRVPYNAECRKNKPHFLTIMLPRKTVKKDLEFFIQTLVQSRVLESVVVCDMTNQ